MQFSSLVRLGLGTFPFGGLNVVVKECSAGLICRWTLHCKKGVERTRGDREDASVDVSRWLGSGGFIRSTSGLRIGAEAAVERLPRFAGAARAWIYKRARWSGFGGKADIPTRPARGS